MIRSKIVSTGGDIIVLAMTLLAAYGAFMLVHGQPPSDMITGYALGFATMKLIERIGIVWGGK